MHISSISIISPVRNAKIWFDAFARGIFNQQILALSGIEVEISIFEDSSDSDEFEKFQDFIYTSLLLSQKYNIRIIFSGHMSPVPRGCGFGKNIAIQQSTGQLLVFADVDDVMLPERLAKLLQAMYSSNSNHTCCNTFGRSLSCRHEHCSYNTSRNLLFGSQFLRFPLDATVRYSLWGNTVGKCWYRCYTESLTSHGPCLIMPSWAICKQNFLVTGYFSERLGGFPEDLEWYLRHAFRNNGLFHFTEQPLVIYTYHQSATTFSVLEDTIIDLRLHYLENYVFPLWDSFSIWGYKYARRVFNKLAPESKMKARAFLDVNPRLIGLIYQNLVPIVHFEKAQVPILICVKRDLTGGKFEENVNLITSKLREGRDYLYFA